LRGGRVGSAASITATLLAGEVKSCVHD
jgi:hypothetical protein